MMETAEKNNKLTEQEVNAKKTSKIMNIIAKRAAYYRANPHIFCEEYLNLKYKLKTFQKILIYMMNYSNYFMFLACRGLGKTFLTALFCCVRCILYPGTKICVASGRKKQAIEVLEKIINEIMPQSNNLKSEISDFSLSINASYIEFYNGSRIRVVTASDSARGARANLLVCDEFRLIPLSVLQLVLKKFLTAPRQPGYLSKKKYEHLRERNKEVYMSSCWYQSHWSYEKAKAYAANLVNPKQKYFICGLPYQLAIKEGLLDRAQVEDDMSESDFNSVAWSMEMECLFYSDTEGGLYSYEDIERARKIKYPVYPLSSNCPLTDKRIRLQPRQDGEIRLLSADIALMSSQSKNNDATSLFFNQVIPTSSGKYMHNITYTENQEGLRTDEQALIIRKLFDELDADYLVIDARGIGLGVIDMLMTNLYDPNTGVTYDAISCCNNKEIAERCHVPGAPKKIWAIQATSEFNSHCALGLRESIQQGQIRLLASEFDFDELMQPIAGFSKLSLPEKVAMKSPYINTTLLSNELIELKYEAKDNVIRVKEMAGKRKDRYSSLSYNVYVAKQLERDYKILNAKKSVTDLAFQFRAPKLK